MPAIPAAIVKPGYKPQSDDTSIDADVLQMKQWRRFPIWKKAQSVSNWTQGCCRLCLAGIKQQYPTYTPTQRRREFVRRRLGEEWVDLSSSLGIQGEIMIGDPIALALQVAEIFTRLDIPYLVGGSVASSLLGEPRATLDLDVVADLKISQVDAFIAAVEADFYVSADAVIEAISYQSSFNLIHLETNEKVDIFILKPQPLSQSEMERRQRQIVTENPPQYLYLPTPEDIILQKLIWYQLGGRQSERQWRDLLGVLKVQGETLNFQYLWHWAEPLSLSELLGQAVIEAGMGEAFRE